jgi:ribosomal protein L11 methyltransferase
MESTSSNPNGWKELLVSLPSVAKDEVSGLLFDHGCVGIHEDPLPTGRGGARVRLHAYFHDVDVRSVAEALERSWSGLGITLGAAGPLRMMITDLGRGDWQECGGRAWKPIYVGDRICIVPPWQEGSRRDDRLVIRIDQGTSFGTGSHETTMLCLQELERCLASRPARRVLDVGTGSGVLSIAAARLGASQVLGIDIAEAAVAAARKNMETNGVEQVVTVESTHLEDLEGTWDLVVANLLPQPLRSLCEAIASRVAPGGTLLLSGIPAPQAHILRDLYLEQGLTDVCEETLPPSTGREEDRWVLLRFERSSGS